MKPHEDVVMAALKDAMKDLKENWTTVAGKRVTEFLGIQITQIPPAQPCDPLRVVCRYGALTLRWPYR